MARALAAVLIAQAPRQGLLNIGPGAAWPVAAGCADLARLRSLDRLREDPGSAPALPMQTAVADGTAWRDRHAIA